MKKLLIGGGILIFLLLILLVVVLIMRNRNDETITPTQSRSEEIVLEYWGLWEPESVMEELIKEYEDANSNIKIKYSQRSFSDYEEILYTRLEQGSTGESPAPDILKINNSWLPRFEKLLSPVPSNIMDADTYEETFFPTCIEDFTGSDGNIYALPLSIEGLGLYYNKVLLSQAGVSQPPEDWDGIIELAKDLTKTDANGRITQAGLAIGTSNNVYHAADIFSFLLLQNNIEVISENEIFSVDLDNNSAKSALMFYRSFVDEHKVWSANLPLDLDMFFRGELAMFLAPSWRVFDIIESAPSIEFDFVPAPQLEANDPVYYAMYWGESVSMSSNYKDEAWKFLKFLAEEENMQKFHSAGSSVRAFGQAYSRVDIAEDLEDKKYVGTVIKMAPYMKAWKMSQNPYVEEQIKKGIEDGKLDVAEKSINLFLENL